VAERDWAEWHLEYDEPGSLLSRRLAVVQAHLRAELDRAPACGIFGNITGDDVRATVAALPSLSAPGALVLWTRHRKPPDLTAAIRSWFDAAGFREEAFDASPDGFMTVGAHRLTGQPAALVPGQRLFSFG
jgi:hypothetical protein